MYYFSCVSSPYDTFGKDFMNYAIALYSQIGPTEIFHVQISLRVKTVYWYSCVRKTLEFIVNFHVLGWPG